MDRSNTSTLIRPTRGSTIDRCTRSANHIVIVLQGLRGFSLHEIDFELEKERRLGNNIETSLWFVLEGLHRSVVSGEITYEAQSWPFWTYVGISHELQPSVSYTTVTTSASPSVAVQLPQIRPWVLSALFESPDVGSTSLTRQVIGYHKYS